MAKNIRWQIPFVSIQGVHYRVDIYDEGKFTPIQLTAGPTPFVTNEDNSDDFFAPVRTQTGTLQVCTLKPGGGYITLDELLPANNIARPVRMMNLDTTPSPTIEWQGFLSCEAYSQDYTGIPQILDIPLISVLEAMASVQADQTKLAGLNTVSTTIINILEIFIADAGISYFSEFYVPGLSCGRNILEKKIDATILFDMKEYNNENSTTYIVIGLSLQDCLKRIAVYMGWVVREKSNALYFVSANEATGYGRSYRQGQLSPGGQITYQWIADLTDTSISTQNISALQWMGTGHQRSISAGAKSVEVVAKVEKYKLNIQLPACPVGSLLERYRQLWKYAEDGDWLFLLANSDLSAYSNVSFAYYTARLRYSFFHFDDYSSSMLLNVLSYMAAGVNSSALSTIQGSANDMFYWHAGAFLCRYDWEATGTATRHDVKDALYCVFFPHSLNYSAGSIQETTDFDPSHVGAIFSINNVLNYRCNLGYIKLSATADTVFMWPSGDYLGAELIHSSEKTSQWFIALELRFGDKWWDGSSWQSSWCTFKARMSKSGFMDNWVDTMSIEQTDGLLIPITDEMHGLVTLKIWPMASPTSFSESSTGVLEMIFTSLTVEHVTPNTHDLTDRGENHYFRLLGTNFRDEISIETELASMLNNLPSPSLVMEDVTTPMKELNYGSSQSPDIRRPEVDLLNRLAAYYGAARQRLELEVAHPTVAPLPLLKLNGINDGRVYLPLSESRDWQTGVCKLTCFETTEAPAES